ncbi:hypothetical protein QVD17_39153 [Tagetes erecta]|uniref:BRI1 kinase inhibitor 1 n=1 Tax=Tagetes erecta TaxID=13708 RepID=A0AAD8NGV7_TARER|nr:hypothetical protein QVD17_39153 [Tagetes erecta]
MLPYIIRTNNSNYYALNSTSSHILSVHSFVIQFVVATYQQSTIDMSDKIEHKKTYLKQQSTPPSTTTTSPPSPTSSPTHEFSFTTTQHHNPNTYDDNKNYETNKTTLQPAPVIDLTPAGEIFFQGQLLPLRPLSDHQPDTVDTPRSSTNSMDSFTLPINLLYYQSNTIGNTSFHCHHQTTFSDSDEADVITNDHNQSKSKSFSIFGIPKWTKRFDDEREGDNEDHTKERNKKLKLDIGQLIKRYMKMVRPLLSFPKSRRSSTKYNHQSYSFSSNSFGRKPPKMSKGGRRRGQFSAPASMRASPANSGILVASGCVSPTKSTSESTMEELHAAIQAAIAHCKNSIAMEEKIQS